MKLENHDSNQEPIASASPAPGSSNGGSMAARLYGKARAWYCRKSPVLMFVLVLAGLVGVYYVASLSSFFHDRLFPALMRLNAVMSNVVLNWLGEATTVNGTSIFSKRFSVDVRRGCDAIEPTVFFFSAVLAFPSSLRKKLPGMLVGTLLLLLLNLVRIITLFLTGVYYPKAFHAMHATVWQIAFILAAVVFWALWIRWASRPSEPIPNVAG